MRRPHCGQALMIAVLIMSLLVLSIPVIILSTGVRFRHGVRSQHRQAARSIAQLALDHGIRELSAQDVWHPFKGSRQGLPASFNPTTPAVYSVLQGTYTISVMRGEPDYRVKIIASAYVPASGGQGGQRATIEAQVSNVAMGILSPSGAHASAALELHQVPVLSGSGAELEVHWGPIVLHSTDTWTLTGEMDAKRFPRKFSQAGITGSSYGDNSSEPPNSNNKDYWTFLNPGTLPQIDVPVYAYQSNRLLVMPAMFWNASLPITYPTACGSSMLCPQADINTRVSGRFDSGMPVFGLRDTAANPPYAAKLSSQTAIYVNNDAIWRDVQIDMYPAGAFVVRGNLTIGRKASANTGLDIVTLTVPPTADKEYPFYSSWPCAGRQGQACGDNGSLPTPPPLPTPYFNSGNWWKPRFRGFLYVDGDLTIDAPGNPADHVVLIGAVRVNGTLRIINGSKLYIFYNDVVNHTIATTSTILVVETRSESIE